MQSACVWGFLHTGNLGHLKEYGWISNTATAAELNLLSSPAGERQRGGSRRERGEEERRRRRKGVCVKRTRYEGRQRREKQRGRDLSEETALAGAQRQRAKKKEGVEKGGGRRMEGWGEWTYPLFADCCLLMDHFKFNDGKERVNHKYKLINPAWPALLQREKTLCNQKDAGGSEEVMSSPDWPRCFDSKLCLDRVDPIAPRCRTELKCPTSSRCVTYSLLCSDLTCPHRGNSDLFLKPAWRQTWWQLCTLSQTCA